MAQTTHYSSTAQAYARSLMEIAAETGAEASVGADLATIRQLMIDTPTFGLYLADPAVSADERGGKIKTIFGGRVSPLLLNTIGLMNRQGKLKELPSLCGAYRDLLEQKQGKIEVDVTVATRLTDGELEDVRQRVGTAMKKTAVVRQHVDESIIGGLILKVGDKLIDGSVKSQLNQLKQNLLLSRSK